MFEYQKDKSSLDLEIRGIHKIFESMNTPRISIPEMSVERAKAFVASGNNRNGFFVHIYLLLIDSNFAAIYSPRDLRQIHEKNLFHFQEEALHFAESMGFMMDDINYLKLPKKQQEHLQNDMPIFYSSPPPPSPYITTAMPVLSSQISNSSYKPSAKNKLQPSSFQSPHPTLNNEMPYSSNPSLRENISAINATHSQENQTFASAPTKILNTPQNHHKLNTEKKEALVRFLSFF